MIRTVLVEAEAAFAPLMDVLDETWSEELRDEIDSGRKALAAIRAVLSDYDDTPRAT